MPRFLSEQRMKRLARSAAIVAVLLCVSGCVYLRLLRFKNQLRDFDEHVEASYADGLSLLFRQPVLEDGDFVFITDSEPTERNVLSEEPPLELWSWRFEKERAEGDASGRGFSTVFGTLFEDGMLVEIAFDPALLSAVPSDLLVALFRSMGKAKVNKIRRSATSGLSGAQLAGLPLPTLRRIDEVMGPPTRIEEGEDGAMWSYTFNFYNPENGKRAGEFEMTFLGPTDDLDSAISGLFVTGSAR